MIAPEPNACECGLLIPEKVDRCHFCIAELAGNFRQLVDRLRGPAYTGPFQGKVVVPGEVRSDLLRLPRNVRKSNRKANDPPTRYPRPRG